MAYVYVNGFIFLDTACDVDQGWKLFMSNCYKYFNQVERNRAQARLRCQALNGNLVMFQNADKHQFVTSDVLPADYSRVWIGLSRDPANEEVWKWDDGSLLSFNKWEHNEPKNNHKNCAQMMNGTHYGGRWNNGWHDTHCDNSAGDPGFVCEREVF
ncbi:snaclec VP12 subunit B-like [Stylophora pistillata]|uniref:snaclec VP12 subunit B-like n=1 Tax=Stylophora pistillata TaxID=50429 RepID=UPI000C03AE56|nr:snaclec VP12 subunit B-like [Stylophora pistillata]